MWAIKIVGLATGEPSPADGRYVKEYDPDREGVDNVTGEPMLCHLVTTSDPRDALLVSDVTELHKIWAKPSRRWPTRPDGRPNRPLSAFTVTMEMVDQDAR